MTDEALAELPAEKKDLTNDKVKYPKRVFLIIGSEFCERFSYYGMRTVLVLYLRNFLTFSDDDSTSLYHAFTMFAYFTPLLGGIIADSYWGRYKTIIILSIVYIFGHGLKTIAAIPHIPSSTAHITFSILGLLMIALGTGGIKPCVSSFGGDQFDSRQVIYRNQFFSMFYFSINCGALLAKIIMPIFRADVRCYPGHEDDPKFKECYSLAFGVPGLLMILATGLLIVGSKSYTYFKPTGSVFLRFCSCIFSACRNKWNTEPSSRNKEHWIDYADATPGMKRDTKYVLAILLLFSPLPLFWALFDQQGSRWTLQALQMDRYWGSYLIKPEQMDTFNPLLIITLIPLFEATLYPGLRRLGIPFTPIRRMALGLILAGVAFICTATVQFEIDKSLTPLPKKSEFFLRFTNAEPRHLSLSSSEPSLDDFVLSPFEVSDTKFIRFSNQEINISYTWDKNWRNSTNFITVNPVGGKVIDVVLSKDPLKTLQRTIITRQNEGEETEITFINVGSDDLSITLDDNFNKTVPLDGRVSGLEVPLGERTYSVYRQSDDSEVLLQRKIDLRLGGLYSIYLIQNNGQYRDEVVEDVNHFTVNVAWMIPQYVILTIGEVFLSVTGLDFAYSQAPPSMKSVVASFWLLTVSLGNVIVIIVAQLKAIDRRAHEFILFSILIFVAAGIFMFLGKRFTPVDDKEFEDNDRKDEDEELLYHDEAKESLMTSTI